MNEITPQIAFVILIVLFAACSSSKQLQHKDLNSPKQVFRDFLTAVSQKNVKEAKGFLYEPDLSRKKQKLLRRANRRRLTSWLNILKKKKVDVGQSNVQKNAAVVILITRGDQYQKGVDPDPVYLVKNKGKWKVLPDMTAYDHKLYGFSKGTVQNFGHLEKWFEDQKEQILQNQ